MASLNVWGLSDWVARDLLTRMQAIGQRLEPMAADVVAFQEAWDAGARAVLIDAGARAGLTHVWDGQRETGGSGLVVLSRWPITPLSFEPYRTRGLPERVWHADYWGAKGFGELAVATPTGEVAFYVTHLHAQYDWLAHPEYRAHRMGQVIQLAARLRSQPRPLIAVGDFNHREGDADYRVLQRLTGLSDAAVVAERREPTVLATNPYVAGREGSDSRIDYMWFRSPGVRLRELRRAFDESFLIDGRRAALSDHAGLVADFDLEAFPTASPPPRPDPETVAIARASLEAGRKEARARRGQQRGMLAAGVATTALGSFALRQPKLSRRRLLRLGLAATVAAAVPVSVGAGLLSEGAIPEELADFDGIERLLDEIVADGAALPGSRAGLP